MQAHAKVCLVSVALMTLSGCAGDEVTDSGKKPPLRAAAGTGGTSYDYPTGYGGSAPFGKGGAGAASAGSAGRAGSAGVAGSSGSSAHGGEGGASAGSAGGGSTNGGSSNAGGASSSADCSSLTRVKLSTGECVARVTEYDVARYPTNIVVGSDRRIWFDDDAANQLVQLDGDGNVLRRVDCDAGSSPRALIGGTGDAILWYTNAGARTLIKMTADDAKASVTTLGFVPTALALGKNDDMFLSEQGKAIYRLLPNQTPKRWAASPLENVLLVSPDSNVWVSEGQALAKLAPSDGVKEFALSDTANANALCATADSIWFSDGPSNQLVRVSFTGSISSPINLPTNTSPDRIIAGPDKALWFVEVGMQKIGRFDLETSEFTHYPLPTPNADPYALTVGADGNIWFTEPQAHKLGRLIPDLRK